MRKEEEAKRLKKSFKVSQAAIAKALASDFICSFYVNIKTKRYIENSSSDVYKSLNLPALGNDFFSAEKNGFLDIIHPLDRDLFLTAFNQKNVTRVLSIDKSMSLEFRVVINNQPIYMQMKITKMIDDEDHIVVGLRNIDAHMKRIEEYEKVRKNNLTFAGIATALAADYVSLVYVNTKDDSYKEYYSTEKFKKLGVPQQGKRVFWGEEGLFKHVYEDDVPLFEAACSKENILRVLSIDTSFAINVRLLYEGNPIYVRIKISKMMLEDEYHVVIGISNIDEQMKREQVYNQSLNEVREIAYRDSLTGVKSKHAFSEFEASFDEEIKQNSNFSCTILVCDVNGLKKVNDTLGHSVGDQYIKDSCYLICHTFKHSPVYRVGGDEFVVVLSGDDYTNRKELLKEINDTIDVNHTQGGISISIGYADYIPNVDHCLQDLFKRADEMMYQRKKELKAERVN
ncbi:MAG: GGDEF domain-containing protein [Bacilli bacterium]|nr:GGDEF domain-containing protein [Bacilli bacterium]